jgi:hypothetical protein
MKFLPEKLTNNSHNDKRYPPLDQLRAWAADLITMTGFGETGRPVL